MNLFGRNFKKQYPSRVIEILDEYVLLNDYCFLSKFNEIANKPSELKHFQSNINVVINYPRTATEIAIILGENKIPT